MLKFFVESMKPIGAFANQILGWNKTIVLIVLFGRKRNSIMTKFEFFAEKTFEQIVSFDHMWLKRVVKQIEHIRYRNHIRCSVIFIA